MRTDVQSSGKHLNQRSEPIGEGGLCRDKRLDTEITHPDSTRKGYYRSPEHPPHRRRTSQMGLSGPKSAVLLAYRPATKLIQFTQKQVVKPYIINDFYGDGVYSAVYREHLSLNKSLKL